MVDGDARSAAIAAASIVAKVVRDRVMRRLDALYPNYGFVSHVGYITPAHNRRGARVRAVRASSPLLPGRLLRGRVNRGERVALRHYRLRGYRLLAANARVGRFELDLVLRRGGRVLVVEVKEKSGTAFGHPLEMIDDEKVAARHGPRPRGGSRAHPEVAGLDVAFEAAGVRGRRVERVPLT